MIYKAPKSIKNQGRLIRTTEAWKQTLPPSDRILYYVSECLIVILYLSCKNCFNVLNYLFSLFVFNLYCLA